MASTRTALALVFLATLGCPSEPDPVDCTTEARASIQLTVLDESGAPVTDASATYTAAGATADCESTGDGTFVCGYEVAGEIEVTITATGFATDTFTQVVESDECHVITETVERTLSPVECTDIAVPSIEVTVTDSQGAAVETGDVVWNMADEDDLPEPCDWLGGNVWTCAYEVSGELAVEISNAGPYEPYRETVTVEADECHVITESLSAVLQVLPD
jgi:hypothetical protein